MEFSSSPRTWAFLLVYEVPRPGRKGFATMAVTLMFFVFSILGMSMLLLSRVHLKAEAGRKQSLLLDYASENGVKRGLEALSGRLDSGETLVGIDPTLAAVYREDALSGGWRIAEDLTGWAFPRLDRETWEGMSWSSSVSCARDRVEDGGEFISVTYGFRIDAEGSLSGFSPKRTSGCTASLEALAGRLPLPCIPFLINKKMAADEATGFMDANGITFRKAADGSRPRLQAVETPLIPKDATPQLAKALKVGLLRPEDLAPSALRRVLGLEPSNDPVPDGVYLIQDDLGLGGVFVQGDVAEMVAAIDGDFQVIRFTAETGEWVLRFSPSLGKTVFETPAGILSFDLVPAGIICVNGAVESLGGGVIGTTGRVEMVTSEPVPSILAGVSLTLVSSGRVTISSHLFSQGVRWQDGTPYLKDPAAQVIIFTTGKDFLNGVAADGAIAVAGDAPCDLVVQASLIAAGAGFVIEGSGKKVELLGGLQATNYASGGSSLTISPDRSLEGAISGAAPLTTSPMLYVASFKVLEWREY